MATYQGFLLRLSIFVVGILSGLVLFFPMGMMGDSGTRLAITLSSIGVIGSLFLIIGGIVGTMTKRWIALVPGTIFILIALTPALPPFAIMAVLLIYCCYVKPTRSKHDDLAVCEVDSITVVDLLKEECDDEKYHNI